MNSIIKTQIIVSIFVLISATTYADGLDDGERITNTYETQFAGINFGVGLALSFKYGEDRVDDASVEAGVVRVNKEHNRQAKIMLETHYFFPFKIADHTIGLGPFLGVEPDSSGGSLIGAYALGGMVGFKRSGETKSSWNIGVAYCVNTNVKTLGDGIEEGQPLPNGESEIRYKEINQPGWLIMTSFSW